MTYHEFTTIIADIERHMEGEGYFLWVHAKSGRTHEGSWAWLKSELPLVRFEIITLSPNDQPPLYLPLSAIESIRLSAR